MAAQIMAKLGDAVTAVDEVHGFRYFETTATFSGSSTAGTAWTGGNRRRGDRRGGPRIRRRQLRDDAEVSA